MECKAGIRAAFDLQIRIHQQSGQQVQIASTTCRMVSVATFRWELQKNGLTILQEGLTASPSELSGTAVCWHNIKTERARFYTAPLV